jgi:cob(I)alamin adenosyltransferase
MAERGFIQVYTGDGKGKTTAAIGQIIRALGHNLKACYISFHKDADRWGYGELKILKNLGVDTFSFANEHPHFCKKVSARKLRNECKKAVKFIKIKIFKASYDILVLDEINIALRDGYMKEKEVEKLLKDKPKSLNIILTGRGAPDRMLKKADLVSEMKKVKHPFDRRIKSRMGVEF